MVALTQNHEVESEAQNKSSKLSSSMSSSWSRTYYLIFAFNSSTPVGCFNCSKVTNLGHGHFLCDIALTWVSQNMFVGKSTLVQVTAGLVGHPKKGLPIAGQARKVALSSNSQMNTASHYWVITGDTQFGKISKISKLCIKSILTIPNIWSHFHQYRFQTLWDYPPVFFI